MNDDSERTPEAGPDPGPVIDPTDPAQTDRQGAAPSQLCLLAATQALNSADSLISGLERAADCLRTQITYDTLAVLLLDEMGRELHFELAVGFPGPVAEHWRFGMGQGLVGSAAERGEAILVPDTAADPRYIAAAPGTRSELAIPLKVKERTIGVLDLGSSQPGFFRTEHLQLLEPISDLLASAIETARLYQNTREQARTLSLLHEVSRELASILERDRLLARVAEVVRRLIEYDVFAVLLWSEETRLLEPAIAIHRDGREVASARSLALGQGLCGTAAALRQTLRVANVHLDPRYEPCVDDLDVRSELVIPLTFKERLVGVVDLQSRVYDAFGARHEQALSTLASSLTIALENARLYERIQQEEQRLADDLCTAREIQRQLLPQTSPWLPGLQIGVAYEPARQLGGDFYDFLPYGDGRVAIAVGDVAGKSTSAALYGSLAVGILREYAARSRLDPGQILADMNGKLLQLGIENRFLAMLFALYDTRSGSLRVANSGLPLPFLVSRGDARPLEVVGVPLGLLADRSYQEIELSLGPGDALVVCSDGIEESLDAEGRELGRERVAGLLRGLAAGSAREIADGVLGSVRRLTGSREPGDDRTVLVMKATNG